MAALKQPAMRYFIRSLKTFVYFLLIFVIIVAFFVLSGMTEFNIETMFRNGYNALWQIALLFAVLAAIYPKVGYVNRMATMQDSWDNVRNDIKKYMENHYYSLEKAKPGMMTFRHDGTVSRFSRMFEDRITITATEGGVTVEGLRKDVLRIASGLERIQDRSNG